MNITELLSQPMTECRQVDSVPLHKQPVHDDDLMMLWEKALEQSGFLLRAQPERNTLTDTILSPVKPTCYIKDTPIHVKIIGRHMNGSFRCHIGTGKASHPIRSTELCRQMRLLAVFFRAESSKSQLVSPDFIFFPTWLLHLFRYTQYGATPGRTDVRFLENAALAKEDHIYRLNHVLNTLFRFNLHQFDQDKLHSAVALANYLFDTAGLDHLNLPRPLLINTNASDMQQQQQQQQQPALYSTLCLLLHAPRPSKLKPMCHNCNTKPASRRKLCVACYRYQLKHGEARPLRLIVANRPGPTRVQASSASFSSVMESNHSPRSTSSQLPVVFYSPKMSAPSRAQKFCANCGVQETHQWYRNLCGSGHWCETCKSYYLRHTKVRPPELFVKAAKRKVDIRTLVNWSAWSWDEASPVSSPTISASSRQTTAESRRSSASSITSTSTASSLSTCSSASFNLPWTTMPHQRPSTGTGSVISTSTSGSSSPSSVLSSPHSPPSSLYHTSSPGTTKSNLRLMPEYLPTNDLACHYDPLMAAFSLWSPE